MIVLDRGARIAEGSPEEVTDNQRSLRHTSAESGSEEKRERST